MKEKRRRGFSLVELIVVMIIMVILISIVVNGVGKTQKKARLTDARSAFGTYEDAFIYATSEHAIVFSERADAWGTNGSSYSDKVGLASLVKYMNQTLDEPFQLFYNDTTKRYESLKDDPWGGKYILTGYPVSDGDAAHNYNDATKGSDADNPNPGWDTMGVSVWCTGNAETVDLCIYANSTGDNPAFPLDEECYGVGLTWTHGLVDVNYHGFEDEYPFKGYYLIYQ